MSVVSPHQSITAEAPKKGSYHRQHHRQHHRQASPGAGPPGSASLQTANADRPLPTAQRSQTAVPRRLRRYLSLADFEATAGRRLPRMIYGFIAGVVETDAALRDNRRAFDEYGFVSRVLNDVSSRNQTTTLFGKTYAAPFGIPPFGSAALGAYAATSCSRARPRRRSADDSQRGLLDQARGRQAGKSGRLVPGLSGGRRDPHRAAGRSGAAAGYDTCVVTADVPVPRTGRQHPRRLPGPARITPQVAWDIATIRAGCSAPGCAR